MATPYNPNNIEYSGARPESNIAPKLQSVVISNYALDRFIAIDKEIKGGLHRVNYLSQLFRNDYDGVHLSKRVKGMLCHVSFNDDGSVLDKYYSLKTMPGSLLSHWEEIGSGSSITLTGSASIVADIIERDALTTMVVGDLVTVIDARTAQEIIDDAAVYPQTYIWNDTEWVVISPYGQDPDRHVKNFDTQLVRESTGVPVTADAIANHMTDLTKHKNLNDLNDEGAVNEDWSSLKIKTELDKKLSKEFNGDGDLFLADDGTYKAVTSAQGSGLNKGDILNGGDSLDYT